MRKDQSDIGYCISQALKDYAVFMDPEICLLLSSPLWLGLNVTEGNAYCPMEANVISYLNPRFLENFSVNSNSLFIPVRGNSADHFTYLETRLNHRKKILVKLSGHIFGNGLLDSAQVPVLALVDGIAASGDAANTTVSLAFAENNSISLSRNDFVNYWHSDSSTTVNTEWFALIPTQTRPTRELLEQKLKASFTRQYHSLKPNDGVMLSGTAVIEFLGDSLYEGHGRYSTTQEHASLWDKKQGIVELRRKYARALEKADAISTTGYALLQQSLFTSAQVWEDFLGDLGKYTTSGWLKQYAALFATEDELIKNFKKIL